MSDGYDARPSLVGCTLLVSASVRAADEPRIITPTLSSFETLSRFTELLDTFRKNYVQPSRVNTEWYTTVALRAFVRSIDPEADLLTPEEAMSASDSNAAPADIGLAFVIRGGIPTVVSPSDGKPPRNAPLAGWGSDHCHRQLVHAPRTTLRSGTSPRRLHRIRSEFARARSKLRGAYAISTSIGPRAVHLRDHSNT